MNEYHEERIRQPSEEFRSSFGRLVMVGLLLVTGVYFYLVLHPSGLLYRGMAQRDREDYWYRFRVMRFAVAILVVFALLLFTLSGYYYTTYQIGSRLLQTNVLAILIAIAFESALRWLLVRRRRMKLDQLASRVAEAETKVQVEQTLGKSVQVDLRSEPGLDADVVSKQAKELVLVITGVIGFWFAWQIWADIIPAVGILNRVDLWPVAVGDVVEQVTLQHLFFSVLTIVGTVLGVKNIPGILELLLLRRLPMDAGARYAVATIFRYVIALIGMIIEFGFLKVQWSQFSWLVAAISVGLGFGLQEIVANFVSGLILLLERPVRIGDVVTIEGTTGVISRIQMRATTVTNWDQQELVVPNKNLITNSIFNWTLTNVLTRITLEVGVAYGSDVEFVTETIMNVVKSNTEVVDDPAPSVTFQTFGDSSLNFTVRCCISGADKRLATIHALQVAISKCLAENDIQIPFPQRVVHMVNEGSAIETTKPTAIEGFQ